eukprot:9034835-Lingulodinium_polyedra.AAC.1
MVRECEDAYCIADEVGDEVMKIFWDKEIAERFAAIDVTAMRVKNVRENRDSENYTEYVDRDMSHQCDCLTDGLICGECFPSKTGLMAHIRHLRNSLEKGYCTEKRSYSLKPVVEPE